MTLCACRMEFPRFIVISVLMLMILSLSSRCYGQDDNPCLSDDGIQDIRLVDGVFGDHSGRVEVKYSGRWGTVCDDFWSFNDADVVCRMLGFRGGVCAVRNAQFGRGSSSSPIWMSNLYCSGSEECLGNCSYIGLDRPITFCNHNEDAGVICLQDEDDFIDDTPTNIKLVNSTTTTITIQFDMVAELSLPNGTDAVYQIVCNHTSSRRTHYAYYNPTNETEVAVVTIGRLDRDSEYSIGVQVQYTLFPYCYDFVTGPLSDPVLFRTNATVRPSNHSIRLIPPQIGVDFMGRVEVLHDGTWGTVCDDYFGTSDANVVCRALGFDRSRCVVQSARMGMGYGTIWLDNLDCPASAEILEDCTHPGWGVHNCRHQDDVGVICNPGYEVVGDVRNFTVVDVTAYSATFRWEPYQFPNIPATFQYQISYRRQSGTTLYYYWRSVTLSSTATEYTLDISLGYTYNVTIRTKAQFSYCYTSFYGNRTNEIEITSKETAPDGPPQQFHVVVLNSTAVEAEWSPPAFNHRNGLIRGYKIFVQEVGGSEVEINVNSTAFANTYNIIMNDLLPDTAYVISVLAYTMVGMEGPRSIHLTARTYSADNEPIISTFGVDGSDRVTFYTYQRNVFAYCGTHRQGVQIDWFFENGTKVGITDRNLREGHYNNGTTILQIATSRYLNYCDGGVYTCVANDTISGRVQKRNFTIYIGSQPDRPSRPFAIKVQSNSITVGWQQPRCSGGRIVTEFNLQYYDASGSYYFDRRTVTVPRTEGFSQSYTVIGLVASTRYTFQVQAATSDSRTSRFSNSISITTLPAAPSPPRDVTTRIVGSRIIEVRWRIPATPNGEIIRYIVYVTPLSTTGTEHGLQDDQNSTQTANFMFPGTARAGNVTVQRTEVYYHIQVTASIAVGGMLNEGMLSQVKNILVPDIGLPVPQSVRIVASTNSSITLSWDYPAPPFEPIQNFLISYTSLIDWRSPMGTLVQFSESGSVMVDSSVTMAKVSPLTPGTSYQFRVSAITERGSGEEVTITSDTLLSQAKSERLGYLQVGFGPVANCIDFQRGSTTDRLENFKTGLVREINKLCLMCGLTATNFKDSVFSCANGLVHQVVFRARILGTEKYSSRDLLSLIQSWIEKGSASVNVGNFRFVFDPYCPSSLDSPYSPDCSGQRIITTPTLPTSTVTTVPSSIVTTAGEITIIVIGLLIVILLFGLITIFIYLILKKRKSGGAVAAVNRGFEDRERTKNIGSKVPLSTFSESARNSALYDSETNLVK